MAKPHKTAPKASLLGSQFTGAQTLVVMARQNWHKKPAKTESIRVNWTGRRFLHPRHSISVHCRDEVITAHAPSMLYTYETHAIHPGEIFVVILALWLW
jgi:hypothetical protein